MAQYGVPDELLAQLKCAICEEFLSHPPIHYHPESGSVCGRHPLFDAEKNTQPIQEKNYECIAGIMSFPCRYISNGCTEKCTMVEMPEHEASCDHKPYFCPVYPLGDCAWQGYPKELHGHFATTHQILLLQKPEFELDIVNNYKEHYLVPTLDEQFILRVEFQNSDKIFRCCVYYIGKASLAQQYEYEVVFKTQDADSSWIQTKLTVESDLRLLERRSECAVALAKLKEILQEPTFIMCEVRITRVEVEPPLIVNECEADVEDAQATDAHPDVSRDQRSEDDKLLDSVECQVCQEYMVPPIYQCVVGHNICDTCKPKVRECPTCRGQIAETRNFALEKLTEIMQYPCKNIEEGCYYRTNSLHIRNHEKECEYKPRECFFHETQKCQWIGKAANLFQHCRDDHSTNVQTGQFFQTTFNPDCERFEIFKIKSQSGLLFKLIYSYTKETFSCTVLCVTRPRDHSKLMYEVEVVDLNNVGLKLISRKLCGFMSDRKDDLKHCTTWNINMVKPFISQSDVKLKISCVIHKM